MSDKPIIATELLKGQGLGNQLFCYISTRCLALDNKCNFAILGREILSSMYFMDLDCGLELSKDIFTNVYHEKEDRLYIGNSNHDINYGCYITGVDEGLQDIKETTLIYGNLQDESYFRKYKTQIKDWLKVKPEYDNYDYSRENLCVINIRGGEYKSNPELFLRRRYWLDAMKIMKNKRADMEFVVVTDDIAAARRILPEVEAHHFDLAGDYTAIKNAHYLIMSNSTFAFFPAYTSDTLKFAIAPKYWARHNVSDGYWASEQNIYSEFMYMDRKGKLYTSDECRKELEEYKKTSKKYKSVGVKLTGIQLSVARLKAKRLIYQDLFIRMLRSLKRRITGLVVKR
jgi:hypothetical protein